MTFRKRGVSLGLEEEEYRELMELFRQSCGSDVQLLQKAVAAGDLQQVLHCTHTIKGSSSNLGLVDLSAAAKRIEELAREKRWSDLESNLEILKRLFDVALKEMML
jgi:histidine phosphotransfer protein HptB